MSSFKKCPPFLFLVSLCVIALPQQSFSQSAPLPEAPTIERDVHLTQNNQYTRAYLPTLQTTADGRVGVVPKQLNGTNGRGVAFHLLVPEKINDPYITSTPGVDILSNPRPFTVARRSFSPGNNSHVGLCDATLSGQPTSQTNPYNCGGDDCYDVTIISSSVEDPGTRTLWGAPTTIRVSDPKTPQARIVSIEADDPIRGSTFAMDSFFEPMTVSDGRLLVARRGGGSDDFSWTDDNGRTRQSSSDAVYYVNDNPDSQAACDVTQWDQIRPISHGPYDSTINQRYGFAMQLFRDPTNTVIADGTPLSTYPWIDKDGDNISLAMLETRLSSNVYPSGTHYDVRCPRGVSSCASLNDSISGGLLHGRTIAGLWTNGKMVTMDNLVNNVDYGIQSADREQREIRLYRGGSGPNNASGWLRIGNGRDNRESSQPSGSPANTTFFDTQEHRFNYHNDMRTVTPRDVTWIVSSGGGSDEFSFDDYTNPDGFIVSNMNQALEVQASGRRVQRNGIGRTGEGSAPAWIANNATAPSSRWSIPRFGNLVGGRIEPVASGGIHGKGLWLNGRETRVDYEIEAQPRNIRDNAWYVGVFVDRRANDNARRTLIAFPDNSELRLRGQAGIEYTNQRGQVVNEIELPAELARQGWAHIGLQLSNRNQSVELYYNGFLLNRFNTNSSDQVAQIFELSTGTLTLGKPSDSTSPGFRGWVDDFKIFAQRVDPEVACNNAAGTLVGIPRGTSDWADVARLYPRRFHRRIGRLLTQNRAEQFRRYACYHDYTSDFAAHLGNIPSALSSIRDDVIFPEGPVHRNAPRPDSSANSFCLSCHTAQSNAGLGLNALNLRGVNAINDPRRQPSQPDPLVFGNIPANWLGQGRPARARVAPREGLRIDRWVLPRSE